MHIQRVHLATRLYISTWTGVPITHDRHDATSEADGARTSAVKGVSSSSVSNDDDMRRTSSSFASSSAARTNAQKEIQEEEEDQEPLLPSATLVQGLIRYRAKTMRAAVREFIVGYRTGLEEEMKEEIAAANAAAMRAAQEREHAMQREHHQQIKTRSDDPDPPR